ncbi:MAG TPA: hypothetical protein VGS20_07570 [Candidatus Acidoferrales bacterium]|nr:hypothetical protein [Candidatus Acidoferrales bacterium]
MARKKNIRRKKQHKPVLETAAVPANGRRKHRHWEVTIFYQDGKKFARVYIDRARAERFAERQKKSPVVRTARVREVG